MILSFLVYFPSQIHGYLSWKKKSYNDEVQVKRFNTKNSIIIIVTCITSSNIVNICGIILMNLRFKECRIVCLFNYKYIWYLQVDKII